MSLFTLNSKFVNSLNKSILGLSERPFCIVSGDFWLKSRIREKEDFLDYVFAELSLANFLCWNRKYKENDWPIYDESYKILKGGDLLLQLQCFSYQIEREYISELHCHLLDYLDSLILRYALYLSEQREDYKSAKWATI